MAEADWTYLNDGLDIATVDRGVTAGIVRPPGGGNFLFAFNSLASVEGDVLIRQDNDLVEIALPSLSAVGDMLRVEDNPVLETVNLPDALASALVKTAEYRNPRPGRLEEVLFYTHPSVERRVRRAMDWKASHPPT